MSGKESNGFDFQFDDESDGQINLLVKNRVDLDMGESEKYSLNINNKEIDFNTREKYNKLPGARQKKQRTIKDIGVYNMTRLRRTIYPVLAKDFNIKYVDRSFYNALFKTIKLY
jgi:hypothetical protein